MAWEPTPGNSPIASSGQSSQDPVNGSFFLASGTTRQLQGKTNLERMYTIYFIYMKHFL
jgi:hypothetical protein